MPTPDSRWAVKAAHSALSVLVVGVLTTTTLQVSNDARAALTAAVPADSSISTENDVRSALQAEIDQKLTADKTQQRASGQGASSQQAAAVKDTPSVHATPVQPSVTKYTVGEGDTLWAIAERAGTDVASITGVNKIAETAVLQPGDTLLVPNFIGVMATINKGDTVEVIAQRYHVDVTTVMKANPTINPQALQVGAQLALPGGRATVVAARTQVATARKASLSSAKTASAATATSSLGINLSLPVPGHVTSPFGQRTREFHKGVDLAARVGQAVHAAAAGTVVFSGWYAGYGRAVIVSHGRGVKTLYGHNSKLLVHEGQSVTAGQKIALAGTSGNSTGPHVHFEVLVNGRNVNPMKYAR